MYVIQEKMVNQLDIKQLRTFVALIKVRNLSRVAEQLGVSQQAVSEHLKKMRNVFNDRLFIRSGNGVQPTALAVALQPKVTATLEAFDSLLTPDTFSPSTASTTFTLACTDFEQVSLLPSVLADIRQLAPKLKIAIKKLELDSLANDLKNGEVDLAITNPSLAPSTYPSETLYRERYKCVVSSQSKLSKNEMTVAQISKIPQVVVSPSRGDFSGAIHHWFEAKGHPREVFMSFPTFSAAIETIHSTDLCGFVPSALIPNRKLRVIELHETPPGFDVICTWHHRLSNDPLTLWIKELLVKSIKGRSKCS